MTKEEAYGCLYSHGLNDEQIEEIIKAISHTKRLNCDKCAMYGSGNKYCDNCGAKMVEPQESEDKE